MIEPQLETRPPWEAIYIDDTRGGFYAITNENWEGERCGQWGLREQANMAVQLLSSGIYDEGWSMERLEDELDAQVRIVQCERCQKDFMVAQVGFARECNGCRS